MKFYRIVSEQDAFFDKAFTIYKESFPKHEQRHQNHQTALLSNLLYHFNAITEADACIGILLYWEGTGYVYIEHFAIAAPLRGAAVGSAILDRFCKYNRQVVLEIDLPLDERSVRRKNFYQRHGFMVNQYKHFHPPYQKQFPDHELLVMSYPQHLTEHEYQLFKRELAEIVMKDVK